MESAQNLAKILELNIKNLEIENQRLLSMIESNNEAIKKYKSSILHNSANTTTLTPLNNNEINLEFKWKASEKTKKFLCELKDNFKTIKKISGDNLHNCTIIGDKCLIKGKINKWKIKNRNDKTHILVGINRSDIDLNGERNYKYGYITNLDNMNKNNLGKYTEINNHKIKTNDIIGIVVDLDKGILSYSINDTDFGVFCDNIDLDTDYVPFIEMINVGSEITLVEKD